MPGRRGKLENRENGPHPVDVYAGKRLRMRRMEVGVSQEKLGDEVGLTFQQVQKYEKGTNRISLSRAYQFATFLQMSPLYFFEGYGRDDLMPFVDSERIDKMAYDLLRSFSLIKDHKARRAITDIVEKIAGVDSAPL